MHTPQHSTYCAQADRNKNAARRLSVRNFLEAVRMKPAKGLKYMLKNKNLCDQQVGGLITKLPSNEFLGSMNSLAVSCSDRLGPAKNTNPGLTPQ